MRDRSRIGNNFFQPFFFDHRATAALRALARRSAADSFAARALPPFSPPSRPKTTAAEFFFFFAIPHCFHILEQRDSLNLHACVKPKLPSIGLVVRFGA